MLRNYIKAAGRPAWSRLRSRFEAIADERIRKREEQKECGGESPDGESGGSTPKHPFDNISAQVEAVTSQQSALRSELGGLQGEVAEMQKVLHSVYTVLNQQINNLAMMRRSVFAPDPADFPSRSDAPFMQASNCQASDFSHPRYLQLAKLLALRPQFHRKQWEWIFVLHNLLEAGVLKPGAKGLGFGVGTEPLPAAFASMGVEVTATDAPVDVDRVDAWHSSNQHSDDISQLFFPEIAPNDLVRQRVSHRPCDMNDIDPSLTNYDFNWSSCCFEHLGSIDKGLEFVVNAVEKTLKVGGVAVHTTEYNASSNEETVTEGDTVIFRRKDMLRLVNTLEARGHQVKPFVIGPTAHALDFHVDVPPYSHDVHLKLLLANYVTTSAGIVITRGR